jgi:hypothetical protein
VPHVKIAAIILASIVGALFLCFLLLVWWRRFVLRRIAAWTAAALTGLTLAPSQDLERRIRENIARVLDVPVALVRVLREKGGARMRVLLCGNASTLVPRRKALLFTRLVRLHMAPWHEFQIEAAPEDPGVLPHATTRST